MDTTLQAVQFVIFKHYLCSNVDLEGPEPEVLLGEGKISFGEGGLPEGIGTSGKFACRRRQCFSHFLSLCCFLATVVTRTSPL